MSFRLIDHGRVVFAGGPNGVFATAELESRGRWRVQCRSRVGYAPTKPAAVASLRRLGAGRDGMVVRLSARRFRLAALRELARLGLTYAQLEAQARRSDFSSVEALKLWITIGDLRDERLVRQLRDAAGPPPELVVGAEFRATTTGSLLTLVEPHHALGEDGFNVEYSDGWKSWLSSVELLELHTPVPVGTIAEIRAAALPDPELVGGVR